jgi:hypothetical protein
MQAENFAIIAPRQSGHVGQIFETTKDITYAANLKLQYGVVVDTYETKTSDAYFDVVGLSSHARSCLYGGSLTPVCDSKVLASLESLRSSSYSDVINQHIPGLTDKLAYAFHQAATATTTQPTDH